MKLIELLAFLFDWTFTCFSDESVSRKDARRTIEMAEQVIRDVLKGGWVETGNYSDNQCVFLGLVQSLLKIDKYNWRLYTNEDEEGAQRDENVPFIKEHICQERTGMAVGMYGRAFNRIRLDEKGVAWAHNSEYATQIAFCPFCGADLVNSAK